jgi:hypothetical protein
VINARLFLFHDRRVRALLLLILTVWGAYAVSGWILAGAMDNLVYAALGGAAFLALLAILKNWRTGVYLFVGWVLFEDLARKFLGNNMIVYFGKDALVGTVYLSFFAAVGRKEVTLFRPKFLLPLLVFFWFGILQVFNPGSTSLAFGLLGLKLYFYYIPLIFVGYALANSERELKPFFAWNLVLASAIGLLGMIQAIAGPGFLNPAQPAEDIRHLSTLYRVAPISGEVLYRPTSVFVSDGRFASYMTLSWLIAFGVAGYLLFRARRGRMLAFVTIGMVTGAIVMSGSRGAVMWTSGSALVAAAAFLWGAPWRRRGVIQVVRIIQRTVLLGGLTLTILLTTYPQALGSRLAFYTETLSPESPRSELAHRVGDYPLRNFLYAFDYPRWPYGYGIGTASLGGQYIGRFFHIQPPVAGVENGYGTLIVEMGILGLLFWVVWTGALARSVWKAVSSLKGSPWFPLGFAIFWFAVLLLFPMTYSGMASYQNFVLNAYLWLLLGILFRLPTLPLEATSFPATGPTPRLRDSGRFRAD